MQIKQERFLDLMGADNTRFVIPVFQRVYSWNARQCEELFDDIVRAGRAREPYFMGMLLFSRDPDQHGGLEQIDVIDGQQLTQEQVQAKPVATMAKIQKFRMLTSRR